MLKEILNSSMEQKFVRMFCDTIPGVRIIFYIDITDDTVLASYGKNKKSLDLSRVVKKSGELLAGLTAYFNDEKVSRDIYETFCRESMLKAYAEGKTDVTKDVEMNVRGGRYNSKIVARFVPAMTDGHVECVLYALDAADEHALKHELGDMTRLTSALSIEYTTVILLNLDTDELEMKKNDPNFNASLVAKMGLKTFSAFANMYIKKYVLPEYQETMFKQMDVLYMRRLFAEQATDRISIRYQAHPNKAGQENFEIKVVAINEEKGRWAVLGSRCIDDLVKAEEHDKKVLSDALAEAEHANKAKSTFLNNMSHDIRTPMNAILGFTELASKHLDDTEVVREYLSKIKTSSKHLLALINQVLDMSRIESGRVQLDESETSIEDVVEELKTIIMAGVKEKGQKLYIDISDVRHDVIFTDKVRLSQVLINIVSNSVKYTQQGGWISIRVGEKDSSRPDYAVFEYHVKDNGMGMSEQFQKYVFESFSREKTATDSGVQGTGLGMAITKRIVDLMGGNISVVSKLGEGTEFVVSLECKVAETKKKDTPVSLADVSFRGKHVLLVEDNELNQEIAQTLLEEMGFTVDVADNGLKAVECVKRAETGSFDVVIMDIQMPIMDGYEATRQIRALEDKKKAIIPIVAMTANAFEEDRLLGEQAGMNGYLTKPIDITAILQLLSKILLPC